MIERVHIRNFQSLHDVEVELGPFTVIVGPSSSGKSAFMRGMRTLTSNRRGAEFISHGERTASISATTDKGIVTLTRSRGTTDNAYTVIPSDPAHPLYPQRVFSKLGGETPPEVSAFLGIPAKDPINYAGQFDKPYLLDDSAGEVARTLGGLTNVNIIFEAARESNRRKLSHSATLRTKTEDLKAIKEKIPTYRNLKAQSAALELAEEQISKARLIEQQIEQLTAAVETYETAQRAITALEPVASQTIPDPQRILDAAANLTQFRDALREQQAAHRAWEDAEGAYTTARGDLGELEQTYAELLGTITDDLTGWITATASPGSITTEKASGTQRIELAEAVRVFALYIETKATS